MMFLYLVPVLILWIFLCIRYIQLCTLRFFVLQLKFVFYFEFGFRDFKSVGFTFYNYITYFASFIFAFGNSLCCFFPNVEEVNILFLFLGCLWLLIILVVSSISLILSLFSISIFL